MSASLGWVLSEEKFFEKLKKTVNFLKIRASYGTLGNDNTGGVAFPYYSRFELYSGATASNYLPNNLGDYVFGSLLTKGWYQAQWLMLWLLGRNRPKRISRWMLPCLID